MLRRSTVVILVIAIILVVAFVFWQQTRGNRESTAEATPTLGVQLNFDFSSSEVVEMIVQDRDLNTLTLEREDGEWKLVRPASDRTDSQAVENAITQLLALRTVSTISSQTPLEDLGLTPPGYIILLRLADGSKVVLNVGDKTPTGSGYYVLSGGANRAIYVIGQFNIDTVLDMIQNPPILPEETPSPMPTP